MDRIKKLRKNFRGCLLRHGQNNHVSPEGQWVEEHRKAAARATAEGLWPVDMRAEAMDLTVCTKEINLPATFKPSNGLQAKSLVIEGRGKQKEKESRRERESLQS